MFTKHVVLVRQSIVLLENKMSKLLLLLLLQLLVVNAVAARTTAESRLRTVVVDSVVLHAIGGPFCKQGEVLFSAASGEGERWISFFARHEVLGIHYVIDRRGKVFSGIAENRVANHALGWNPSSIGIELVNRGDGKEAYTEVQIDALVELLTGVMSRYPEISKSSIVRHSDVDETKFECAGAAHKRKADPGVLFNYVDLLNRL